MTDLPELSRHPRLAERDRLVWGLLTDELAPEEHIEAWVWAHPAVGPRSWGGVVRYMLWGLWWRLLRRLWAGEVRRLRSRLRTDGCVFLPDPYVALAWTGRRIVALRFELGHQSPPTGLLMRVFLWAVSRRKPGWRVARRVGRVWTASDPARLRGTRLRRAWVLEVEDAPESAIAVQPEVVPTHDAYVRRGAELVAALEAAGWVQPAS